MIIRCVVFKRPTLRYSTCRQHHVFAKKDYSTTCGSGNRKKRNTPPPRSSIDSTNTKNFTRHDISRYMKAWEVPVGASSKSQSTMIQEEDDVVLFQSCCKAKKWKPVLSSKKKEADSLRISSGSRKDKASTTISSWFNPRRFNNMLKIIENHTVQHLLPNGYPQSVHPAYKRYTVYSFLGNTASTITMILSTQSLLLAVGVGQQTAAPISATLNWILKDGIGQFGGILFASKISSSSTNSIDADPKKWRMVSSLAMDCAMMIEVTTCAFPHYFVYIASAANIGKNIAFLTASASRAKLHQCLSSPRHSQVVDNLGDITGKATSQSILASLLGTAIGMGLSPYLLNDLFSVGVGCMALSCVNQFCTYQSLKTIPLKSLNRQRLMLLLKVYFQSISASASDMKKENQEHAMDAMSPERICELESFIPLFSQDDSSTWLQIGCGLSMIAPNGAEELSHLHNPSEKYVLSCRSNLGGNVDSSVMASPPIVYLTFVHDAKNVDILRGAFQAFTIMELSKGHLPGRNSRIHVIEDCTDLTKWSHVFMKEHFHDFQDSISSAGWNLDDGVKIMLESETSKRFKFNSL